MAARIIRLGTDKKKTWNGKVQTNIRTNNSQQFEGNNAATHEVVGVEAKRAKKFTRTSPRTLPEPPEDGHGS